MSENRRAWIGRSLANWRKQPIEFIQAVLINPETGQPFELLPAERQFLEHAFKLRPDGKLLYDEWSTAVQRNRGRRHSPR
jgi:hypothetical protein